MVCGNNKQRPQDLSFGYIHIIIITLIVVIKHRHKTYEKHSCYKKKNFIYAYILVHSSLVYNLLQCTMLLTLETHFTIIIFYNQISIISQLIIYF